MDGKYSSCKRENLIQSLSKSSYYQWKKNPIGKRTERSNQIDKSICNIYFESKGRYGSPRIAKELDQRGIGLSRGAVSRHMKQMGLKSKLSRKYKMTTDSSHQEPIAENILNRDFGASHPGEKCVSDITYLHTSEGFLYLTTGIDLFDRKVIGWTISETMTTQETVLSALKKAVANRCMNGNMIFHSDRGGQYAAKATVNYLQSYGFIQSMSRKGNCWENAVAESFFKSLKTELIYGNKLMTKQKMKTDVFEYLEIWDNKNRRHSTLGYLTITEFWNKYLIDNNNVKPAT